MKYAIINDFGMEGWSFVTDPKDHKARLTFDHFGSAYVHAIQMGYSAPFEIVGVFDPKDIKVTVCQR